MKRTLTGLVLTVIAGAGSMMAQSGHAYREREVRHDYAERRSDKRDVRRDEARINHDRRELRRDAYEHNFAGARHERRELGRVSRFPELDDACPQRFALQDAMA